MQTSLKTFALASAAAMTLATQAADELRIPGLFEGRGAPVFEKTKFGQGLRAYDLYECISYPGLRNIRPEEGTLELWIMALEDTEPNQGRSWRPLMSLPYTESASAKAYPEMGVTITEDSGISCPPCCVSFSMTSKRIVRSEPLRWAAGSEHYVVVAWGKRGRELYVDGELLSKDAKQEARYLEDFPARIVFGSGGRGASVFPAKALIDEIKISDIQRGKDYVESSFKREQAPQIDANTLLLSHLDSSLDASGFATDWKKSQPSTALRNAWQDGLDPETDQGSVFLKDESPSLRVFASRFSQEPIDLSLECSIRDFKEKEVLSSVRPISLPAICQSLELAVPLGDKLKPGYYIAKISLKDAKGSIADLSQSFCLLDNLPTGGKIRWGFNVYDDYPFSFAAMRKMGISLLRGHGVYFWSNVEPLRGDFRWSSAKAFDRKCERYGMEVLGILGNTPEWARTPPDNLQEFAKGKNYQKILINQDRYRPKSVEEWKDYVAKAVAANPEVRLWEIWNEPDWHLPNTQGFGFGGTTEQYFELLKASYETVKKIAPEASVVFPGIACAAVADPNFASDLLRKGAIKHFDLLGMHAYGGNQFFKEQADLCKREGYKGPLWMSEFVPDAFMTEPFPTRGKKLAVDQVRHIVRMLPLGISAYVIHSPDIYFPYGQPMEACFSTSLLFRKLAKLDFLSAPSSNAFLFSGQGKALAILWGETPLEFQSNAAKLTLTDHMGFSREIECENGKARFVPGEFLYVEAAGDGSLDPLSVQIKQASALPLPLNGSFEEYEGDAGFEAYVPLKWQLSNEFRDGKANVDLNRKKSGKASLSLERPAGTNPAGKIALEQSLPPSVRGKSFALSACFDVEGASAVASVSVLDAEKNKVYGAVSAHGGEGDFIQRSARVAIPPNASEKLYISCALEGAASKARFDDVKLEPAGPDASALQKTLIVDIKAAANYPLGKARIEGKEDAKPAFGKSNLAALQTGLRDFGPEIFKIQSEGSSCIVLGKTQERNFPAQTPEIKVDAAVASLSFLTTALYVDAAAGKPLGDCVIRYSDGSETSKPFIRGQDVDDWYPPLIGKGVRIAETVKADTDDDANGGRAIFIAKWTNPSPEKNVKSISIRSAGNALLAVFAISGAKP